VLFDTDIFIWVQRGNLKAAQLMNREKERALSVWTYMKLLQGVKDKRQQKHGRWERP